MLVDDKQKFKVVEYFIEDNIPLYRNKAVKGFEETCSKLIDEGYKCINVIAEGPSYKAFFQLIDPISDIKKISLKEDDILIVHYPVANASVSDIKKSINNLGDVIKKTFSESNMDNSILIMPHREEQIINFEIISKEEK